jgi:hypothetical protein
MFSKITLTICAPFRILLERYITNKLYKYAYDLVTISQMIFCQRMMENSGPDIYSTLHKQCGL